MKIKLIVAVGLAGTWVATAAMPPVLDYETLPDGSTPTDGMVISNQYLEAFGVSFQLENGNYPRIATVGPPATAFRAPPFGEDTPAPNQATGTNFLTDNGGIGRNPAPLIVRYSSPVSAASGFILDVDNDEAWDVEAYDVQTQLLARIHIPSGAPLTGNALATPWSFTRATQDLHSVRIAYTGDTNAGVGLAFDNFSPSTAPKPEPSRLSLAVATNFVSLTITGTVFAIYRIEHSDSLATNWSTLTNIFLPFAPFSLPAVSTTNALRRFYRAVGVE